jgi:hypothetical protein
MEKNYQAGHEDEGVPGPRAELQISMGPAPGQEHSIRGLVHADQAHHLITTFGILGSVATGTVAAVLTVQSVAGAAGLAYAELVLALIAAVVIAVCGGTSAKGRGRRQQAGSQAPINLPEGRVPL